MDFVERTQAQLAEWNGLTPPNKAALRFTADIAATITAFEAVRGALAFEEEPADFITALRETKA